MISDELLLGVVFVILAELAANEFYQRAGITDLLLVIAIGLISFPLILFIISDRFTKTGRDNRKRNERIREIPAPILVKDNDSITMGTESDLKIPIQLPDSIRSRHVHILGATGSGKTESVILNFLKQDVSRGFGSIILDAKGDISFLESIRAWVPGDKLFIFDLSDEKSPTYNPLATGTALEAAQRLFSSLTWSEEYYKSRAFSALQRLFQAHRDLHKRNPSLVDLDIYLDNPKSFSGFLQNEGYPESQAEKDFSDLSGLRDQIKILCAGHLEKVLSPEGTADMELDRAAQGTVLYFRLQSLLSPQLVSILGKLLINHLNYLAGTAHRTEKKGVKPRLVPVYLDEFASFASPEFADLISKARSAGYALHFSHQSIGDLAEVSKGFLNQITDNSATKIILRINDPDSAEFFSRAFGTRKFQKVTQRITNAKEVDRAELVGESSSRDAHQFRASPDLFKTLPTGVGSVLIAHGMETPHGASTVLKVRFPKLSSTPNTAS